MNEISVINAVRAVLDSGFAARGITADVCRGQAPSQQGGAEGLTVMLWPISSRRYGWPSISDKYNSTTGVFDHTERQLWEMRIQFTCTFFAYTAADTYTALDLACDASDIIASEATKLALMPDIGILRVQDIPDNSAVDDQDLFKASPSFDAVFTYARESVTTAPVVTTFTDGIHHV